MVGIPMPSTIDIPAANASNNARFPPPNFTSAKVSAKPRPLIFRIAIMKLAAAAMMTISMTTNPVEEIALPNISKLTRFP